MKILGALLLPLLLLTPCIALDTSTKDPIKSMISRSDAILIGKVNGSVSHLRKSDSAIVTSYSITVTSAISGEFPSNLKVVQRGGTVNGQSTWPHHLSADLETGKSYLLFLNQREDKTLGVVDGPAGMIVDDKANFIYLRKVRRQIDDAEHKGISVNNQSADDLVITKATSGNGLSATPRRFVTQDLGNRIPVIADTSTLPAGVTEEQALTALENALAAWENATSALFKIIGTEQFSSSASTINNNDQTLRVQMHDQFNEISNASSTIGLGGAFFSSTNGSGGTVNGLDFRQNNNGYVVVDHEKSIVDLEALLTHEIGHALGFAHSSETFPEPDLSRAQAIMYFQIHGDNRGAQLNLYDTTTAQQAYPISNSVPASMTRRISAVTYFGNGLTNPEVNQIQVHSLSGVSVTPVISSQTNNNGSFSLSGDTVTYTPNGPFGDTQSSNPETSFFDRAFITVSDGQNSGNVEFRIIGYALDSDNNGLPNAWMVDNFGNSSPTAGSQPNDDPDHDGFTNLEEYQMDSDPNDPNSNLRLLEHDLITQNPTILNLTWESDDYQYYEIQSSTNLSSWRTLRFNFSDGNSTTAGEITEPLVDKRYYRVRRLK